MRKFTINLTDGQVKTAQGNNVVQALSNIGYKFIGCYPPRKGETYVMATGKRDTYGLLVAQEDHKKRNHVVVE